MVALSSIQTLEVRIGFDGSKPTYWRTNAEWPAAILVMDAYIQNCPCCTLTGEALVFTLENGTANYKFTGKRIDNDALFELRVATYK